MLIRIVVVVLMLAVVGVFALKRVLFLTNLIRSGSKTSVENNRKDDLGKRITTQFEEVFGQTRLLKWSIPGMAHFFTMWGFFILGSVYVEAFGQVVDHDFHIPIVGRWDALGFLQDFFAVAVLLGIITFAIIRIVREPKKHGRDSRFYGSHTGGAWLILFMIFNVIWTYALVRGAGANTGALPYGNGAFFSQFMGWVLHPFGEARQRMDRDFRAARSHRGHADLPVDRAALQAPAHRPCAGERHVQAAAQRTGPAATRRVQRRADRLRGSRRGRDTRQGQDRGLHLEGLPRLHHVHRMWPLPVAVPGVEHRKAVVPQARHHEPARPPVRQGALHPWG